MGYDFIRDVKALREKYIGARIDLPAGEQDISFTVQDNDYNEYTYDFKVEIGAASVIQKISAPHCRCLVGDDAMHSTYRNKRMGFSDYSRVDDWFEERIIDDGEEDQ